ncbi:hypothetical protein [Actinopolyspora saharensis]|uniref:Uncharacterized protein n=1 Tax=Actinopolyspora saharensis TaxID=995062 RepID=A0A1H0YI72_9ACTN|nr:hypothetical protein [Actinopolyspora saharensis]SDQ14631.1 hypothetical protein SAMN04489718_0461 [Actinopolyspora saharensis]
MLELALLFEADGGVTGVEFLLAGGDFGRLESFGTELLFVGDLLFGQAAAAFGGVGVCE